MTEYFSQASLKRCRQGRTLSLIPSTNHELSPTTPNSLFVKSRKISKGLTTISNKNLKFSPKYQKIWNRARVKLKAILILKHISDHLKLYGTSTTNLLLHTDTSNSDNTNLIRKASKLLMSTIESPTQEYFPRYMISPTGKFRSLWNWVVLIILIYTAICTPFFLSFIDSSDYESLYWIDTTVSILFFIDFLVNLLSAYYDKYQTLVISRWKIFVNYCKGWMAIDILCWFPFDLIQNSGAGGSNFAQFVRLPKLYRLLRFSKLLKLLKTSIHNQAFEQLQETLKMRLTGIKIIKTYLTVIFFAHIISCFWYLTAKLYDFNPDTWVVRYNYQDDQVATLYVASIYWAITTLSTTGYGDIVALTVLEKSLTLIWMAFGLYFFSFNVSSLTSMILSLDLKENAVDSKIAMIEEFSEDVNLNKQLVIKLKNSFRYKANKAGFSWAEKMNILNELPKTLRYEIAMAMHGGAAKYLKFFLNKDQSIISQIIPMLEPMYFEAESTIYAVGDSADEIYFLTKGVITLLYGTNAAIKSVRRWQHFGEIEVVKGVKRELSADPNTYCEILCLNRHVINLIKSEYKALWQEVCLDALKKDKKIEKKIILFEEMEKYNQGDIEFGDFEAEFSLHVNRVINQRLSIIKRESKEVSISELMKKVEELMKIAKNHKGLLKHLGFLQELAPKSKPIN